LTPTDADSVRFSASGGLVNSGFNEPFDQLLARLGVEQALVEFF